MPSSRSLRRAGATLAAWQSPQWAAATAGAAVTTVLVGVPTAVVPSPLFSLVLLAEAALRRLSTADACSVPVRR